VIICPVLPLEEKQILNDIGFVSILNKEYTRDDVKEKDWTWNQKPWAQVPDLHDLGRYTLVETAMYDAMCF
jgi:hypothetical protein